jgi:outer membrane protein TolC
MNMRRAFRSVFVLSLFVLGIFSNAYGQDLRNTAQHPTELVDVINSARQFFPTILATQAGILEKEAGILEANGNFDPRIDGSAYSRLGGLYDSNYAGAGFVQELPFMNAEIFSDYSLSDGDFPVYQNQLVTTDDGKVRLGIALSLLRNRDIDDERFALQKAEIERNIAELNLQDEQLAIFQQVFITYNQWLISARLLAAYEELLQVALTRGEALSRQVEVGDVAEILLVENQQAILQREGLVVDANRQLQLAAERLSLYLRNSEGQPIYPMYDESLPVPLQDESFLDTPIQELIGGALSVRPDIAAIRSLQEQVQLERRLAENLAKPQLDLSLYSSRDLGNSNLSNSQLSRVGTDNVVELSFSIPLETRTARGRRDAANARLDGLAQELFLLINEAERDIRSAIVNLRATSELKDVALRELEVAQTLADAEARRFEAGNSDFLSLNVRERMLGEAQLRRWQAELNHQIALANYYGVSMDLPDYE